MPWCNCQPRDALTKRFLDMPWWNSLPWHALVRRGILSRSCCTHQSGRTPTQTKLHEFLLKWRLGRFKILPSHRPNIIFLFHLRRNLFPRAKSAKIFLTSQVNSLVPLLFSNFYWAAKELSEAHRKYRLNYNPIHWSAPPKMTNGWGWGAQG